MLYNPNWAKPEVKADPFSLESLVAWLEKQPGSRVYCYSSTGECLLSQYLKNTGFPTAIVGAFTFAERVDGRWQDYRMPRHFDEIARCGKRTFGAALERARAALGAVEVGERSDVAGHQS
jgi:hypothetical protein